MKTSNKILLIGISVVAFLFLSMLIYGRQFLSINEIEKTDVLVGKGVKGERSLMETYDTDTLYINNAYEYYLDPTVTGVKVIGDENVLNAFEVRHYRGLYPYRNKDLKIDYNMPISYVIGVKGKTNLTIIAKDRANIKSISKMNIDKLIINAQNRTVLNLENEGIYAEVTATGKSFVDLKGEIDVNNFIGNDQASIDAKDLKMNELQLKLVSTSLVRIEGVEKVDGELEDQATFKSINDVNLNNISFFDKSKHQKESWD